MLIASMDMLLRLSFNPFFPYLKQRIEEGIVSRPAAGSENATDPARAFLPKSADEAPVGKPAN